MSTDAPMRWVEREMTYETSPGLGYVKKEKFLQYRTIENPHETGLQEPIYSEWRDVPTEEE